MKRRQISLLSALTKRVAHRRTKTDQFLAVRAMSIKDTVNEMDDFFNQLSQLVERYKIFRTEVLRTHSIPLLAELDKVKKKIVRTVSVIRKFRDDIPVFDSKKNIKLAHELYKRGYHDEAISMCNDIGVNYFDFYSPIKRKEALLKRQKALISKEVISILEKNKPSTEPKKVVLRDGPKKRYYLMVSRKGVVSIHHTILSKNIWAATHIMHCVEVPRTVSTFEPESPKIGQFVISKEGKHLQIVWINRRDNFRMIKSDTEKDRERKEREKEKLKRKEAKELAMKRKEAKAEKLRLHREEVKQRAKDREKARYQKKKEEKLALIAEQQRLEAEEKARNKPISPYEINKRRGNTARKFGVKLTGQK